MGIYDAGAEVMWGAGATKTDSDGDKDTGAITNRQYLLSTYESINNAARAVEAGEKDNAYHQLVGAAQSLGRVLDRLGYKY